MLCWWNPAYTKADMSEPVCNPDYMWEHGAVPDYLNDLNDCHEMEKVLLDEQLHRMNETLYEMPVMAVPRVWRATAAQRAEAFLKTLCLWRDE